MEIVQRFADRVLAFYDGTVIADGSPAEALGDERVREFITGTLIRSKDGKLSAGRASMLKVSALARLDRRRRDHPQCAACRSAKAAVVRPDRAQWGRQDNVDARLDGRDAGDGAS